MRGGPYVMHRVNDVSVPITLNATASSDANAPMDTIVSYAWDTDGDGLFGTEDTTGGDLTGARPTLSNPAWATGTTHVISFAGSGRLWINKRCLDDRQDWGF